MERMIVVKGQRYILASSLLAEERVRILKNQETFAVFDRHGDIYKGETSEEGVYHEGTRYLSQVELTIDSTRPLLLSSEISSDNLHYNIHLTNTDIFYNDDEMVSRGSLHISRNYFIHGSSCFEKLTVTNFSLKKLKLELGYTIDADFKDIFQIRGSVRPKSGKLHAPDYLKNGIKLSYTGLDDIVRRTIVTASPTPNTIKDNTLSFDISLAPRVSQEIFISYTFQSDDSISQDLFRPVTSEVFQASFEKLKRDWKNDIGPLCKIETSSGQFNQWISRSLSDLHMLSSKTPYGRYPYAGVPWFSTTFGRDGIITALQTLWINPEIAKGVLRFLAFTQSDRIDSFQDAEPGKILHEARKGEMAALKEIPFGTYYGGIDSTPLFVMLAGEYLKVTGDLSFIDSIWSNVERALDWIDHYGDIDGDGFVEYARRSPTGLINQGWKDSHDSVFHADGTDAVLPIALCEVQGYVYQAKIQASYIAKELGYFEKSDQLFNKAEILKKWFHESFWCDDLGSYALAIDGNKKQCKVLTSNAGHCLWTGIADEKVADILCNTLMNEKSFCGWGIRTVAEGEARYNPMSYHNGSIWPHDTAIIAAGLSRFGYREYASKILNGMYEANSFMELNRMPELFCGFEQRHGHSPTLYPLSCAPQAWAAGAVFQMLQSVLGLTIDSKLKRVVFNKPILPQSLDSITMYGFKTSWESSFDVEIKKQDSKVEVRFLRNEGFSQIEVID